MGESLALNPSRMAFYLGLVVVVVGSRRRENRTAARQGTNDQARVHPRTLPIGVSDAVAQHSAAARFSNERRGTAYWVSIDNQSLVLGAGQRHSASVFRGRAFVS